MDIRSCLEIENYGLATQGFNGVYSSIGPDDTPRHFFKLDRLIHSIAKNKVSQVFKELCSEFFSRPNLIKKIFLRFYIKLLEPKFLLWKGIYVRSRNILSGIKILELHNKKKTATRKKNVKNTTDLNTIHKEKSLKFIFRFVKKLKNKIIFQSFLDLLKNQMKCQKIDLFIKLKEKSKLKDILKHWRFQKSQKKLLKRLFVSITKSIPKRLLKIYFDRTVKLDSKKNQIKINLSIQTLFKALNPKIKSTLKSVLNSLNQHINSKSSKALLWRIKFYQLEGLAKHTTTGLITERKKYYFETWRSTVEKIYQITKKFTMKRSMKIYTILHSTIQNTNHNLKLHALYSIKNLSKISSRTSKFSLYRVKGCYTASLASRSVNSPIN